jgi:hypothetical protein
LCIDAAFVKLKLGKIEEAKKDMESVKPQGKSVLYQQLWFPSFQLFQLQLALQDHKLILAKTLVDQLSCTPVNIQIEHDTKLTEIRLDLLQGNSSVAVQKSSDQLNSSIVLDIDPVYQIQYMLLYARALGTADYTRVFTLAFRTMELAERKNLVPLQLEAVLLLCRVFNSQKHFSDTAYLLDLAMPKLLECNWVGLIGEAYELLSDATVGQAGLLKDENARKNLLERALYYTSEAGKCRYKALPYEF